MSEKLLSQALIGYSRVTAEKKTAIANSYALFKKEAKFPSCIVDRMLNSRYFQHFYTRQDRRAASGTMG